MAVKEHVTESEQVPEPQPNHNKCDLSDLLKIFDDLQVKNEHGESIPHICDLIVQQLSKVYFPEDAESIKIFNRDILKVKNLLKELCQTKGNIMQSCLVSLYKLITVTDDTKSISPAVAIVLEVFDENSIPSTVNLILKDDKSSKITIEKTIVLLCFWLERITFAPSLCKWIVAFLNGLNEQRNPLLEKIGYEIINSLFSRLMLPVFRENIAKVVFFLTCIFYKSPRFYKKIFDQFPFVIKALNSQQNQINSQTQTIQHIIDLIAVVIYANEPHNCASKIISDLFLSSQLRPSENRSLCFKESNVMYNTSLHKRITNARVGLVNLGNTCYMNSVLQSLVMTKKFCREILLNRMNSPLLVKVQQLLALMLHSKRPELTPREFLHVAKPEGFSLGHQQDSSEFLGYLLQSLHEQEKKFIQEKIKQIDARNDYTRNRENHDENNSACRDAGGGDIKTNCMEIDDDNDPDDNKTLINQNIEITAVQKSFGGKISIKHKCLNCNKTSEIIDPFYDLQLSFTEIDNTINYTVQYLLDIYCRTEKLDGDNKYSCDKCKTLSDGERYVNIITAPQNLILTLKYFKYEQKFNTRAKLMHKIDLDDLILLKMDNVTVKYRLYAAVVHSGISMDSGHYYTYGADKPNSWFKFNDSYVTKTSLDDLQNLTPPNTPYILFYQMVSCELNAAASHHHHNNSHPTEISLPKLEDLPPHLRQLVFNDNQTYNEEIAGRFTKAHSDYDL